MQGDAETRSRRLIPPVYFSLAATVMLALHYTVPGPQWLVSPWRYAGLAFILAAGALGIPAARRFARYGTTIHPFGKPSVLIETGPFRYTRNPLYASLALTLVGIAVLLGSASPLIVPPIFVYLITVLFIRPEEEALESAFGEQYRAYKQRVYRWFGRC